VIFTIAPGDGKTVFASGAIAPRKPGTTRHSCNSSAEIAQFLTLGRGFFATLPYESGRFQGHEQAPPEPTVDVRVPLNLPSYVIARGRAIQRPVKPASALVLQ
jgi:hypothetical protein